MRAAFNWCRSRPWPSGRPTPRRKPKRQAGHVPLRDSFLLDGRRASLTSMSEPKPASDLPYRLCAGMMVFNRDGRIFVGKRIDQTQEAWQAPQGGIDPGENARQAALRELEEEIGTRNVDVLREHPEWLTYDLPPHLLGVAWKGRYRGQRLKWFAVRFLGSDS